MPNGPSFLAFLSDGGENIIDDIMTEINSKHPGIDAELAKAAAISAQKGNTTAILKEELKTKIQCGRLERGQEELIVDMKEEPQYQELSLEEKEMIKERRDRNRLAAQKCRNKKKTLEEGLEKVVKAEEKRQAQLQKENEELMEELEFLKRIYNDHNPHCLFKK